MDNGTDFSFASTSYGNGQKMDYVSLSISDVVKFSDHKLYVGFIGP